MDLKRDSTANLKYRDPLPRDVAPVEPSDAETILSRLSERTLEVAIDFDGVLFDQSPHVRDTFQDVHGIDPGPAETWPANLTEHPPIRDAGLDHEDTWEVFRAVHNDPDRHREDPLDPHAADVLASLIEAGHTVDVVTARSIESKEPTRDFLDRNGIPHHELVMDDHEKTSYDVLVDDLPQHVERAAQAGSLGLLRDQPYNRAYEADGNPRRVAGFLDVADLFDERLRP